MSTSNRIVASVLLWSVAVTTIAAGELRLSAPAAGDIVPASLSKAGVNVDPVLAFEPVQSAWRVDPSAALKPVTPPNADGQDSASTVQPGARLTGAARTVPVRMRDPVVYLEFDVEVASASRYRIEAILYGTDDFGASVPVAMAQSAQRLEPGVHAMSLLFGPDVLDGIAVGAPWEIRDLRLVDLADMRLQERRARALLVESVR